MLHTPSLHGGWYVTIRPRAYREPERCVVYLVYVPDVGYFVSDETGGFIPLPAESTHWGWHGPHPTPRVAEAVDVVHDPALHPCLDE